MMKKILILIVCAVAFSAHAQSPQGISYQAVATDQLGAPLENQAIAVKFSILQGAPTGSAAYIEIHNTSTDSYGMFNLNLGMGIHQGAASSLTEVSWGTASHFLKVELDIEGDGGFVSMGTQQMMSVPYALYAEQAGNAEDDGDHDPTNEIQTLSLTGDTLSLSDGGSVVIPTTPAGDDQHNGGIYIECVDMGVSLMCPGLGLAPDVSLGPWNGGYQYFLCTSGYGADNYIDCPHWRKFEIHGLPQETQHVVINYRNSWGGNSTWSNADLTLVAGPSGEKFMYFFSAEQNNDCVTSEALGLSIPTQLQDGAFGIYNYYTDFKLYYLDGNSLIDTNILFDL